MKPITHLIIKAEAPKIQQQPESKSEDTGLTDKQKKRKEKNKRKKEEKRAKKETAAELQPPKSSNDI